MKFKKQNGTAKMEVDDNAVKAENGAKRNNRKRKSNEASREVEVPPKMKKIEVIKPKLKKEEEVSTPFSNSKKRQKRKQKGSKAVVAQEKEDEKVPDSAKEGLSIAYLELWKSDRPAWKFNKLRQTWLIKNNLDETKVPDELFPVFIEYMGGGSVTHKKLVVQFATECLKKEEEEDDDNDDDDDDDEENKSEGDHKGKKYDRARMILQSLDSEELIK